MKSSRLPFISQFLTIAAIFAMPAAMGIDVRESVARAEFAVMDSDRSGGVRVMELAGFRRDKGSISWLLKSATWLEFTRADADGDESILLEEWLNHRLAREVNRLGDQVQRFRTSDLNRDRRLNVRELRAAVLPRLTPQQAKDTLAWLDSDSDGLLTMGEFFRYVNLSPDAMRGMRRKDAEDLLQAIGGTFHYTMFNGAVVDYFQQVHSLYWLRSDADVITSCGYGIDLDSFIGKTDAEVVIEAELAGLVPASPMSPGIIPLGNDVTMQLRPRTPGYVDWDRPHASPFNFGDTLPLHPYLVIYAKDGVVSDLQITMGSPPRP